MFLFEQTLGLLSIIFLELLQLLGCKAALGNEEIAIKYVEDGHDRFYLKQSRKLFGEGKNQLHLLNSDSIHNDKSWFWLCLCIAIVFFFLLLVKCCIKLANDEAEETSEVTMHPPPRVRPFTTSHVHSPPRIRPFTTSHVHHPPRIRPFTTSHTSSRSFSSPQRSSRSVILLPEPGSNQDAYFTLENPILNLYSIDLYTSEDTDHQENNLQAQLDDPPPAYDSIFTDNQQNQQNENRSPHVVNILNVD